MEPIPKAAMPIVRLIRRQVARPRTLPKPFHFLHSMLGSLRWKKKSDKLNYCPMGLLPEAQIHHIPIPMHPTDIGLAVTLQNRINMKAFYDWWDRLPKTDAGAAVDAIWPRKRAHHKSRMAMMDMPNERLVKVLTVRSSMLPQGKSVVYLEGVRYRPNKKVQARMDKAFVRKNPVFVPTRKGRKVVRP